MPRSARAILKARGYSDEDLNGLTLLNDQRFTAALEAEDADRERIAAENETIKGNWEATKQWYEKEALPTVHATARRAVTAESEVARLKAQLQSEQDLGLRRVAAQDGGQGGAGGNGQQPAPAAATASDFTTTDQRYITRETFGQVVDEYGNAIAMVNDISEDHRDLFGKRLPGGIGDLRAKFRAAAQTGFRGTLRDFWEKEFNVSARRAELEDKSKREHDSKVATDAVQKYIAESGGGVNPMTRMQESSRSPFVRKPIKEGTSDSTGRQPWDVGNDSQRRSQRVVKYATQTMQQKAGVA